MIRGITYGTFDLYHRGHRELFRRAKEHCDYLIVAVSSDAFNNQKGKECEEKFWVRATHVANSPYVNEVIPETYWLQKTYDILYHKVNIFFMGDDWKGHFDWLPCKTMYLPRTKGVSSSELKDSKRSIAERL